MAKQKTSKPKTTNFDRLSKAGQLGSKVTSFAQIRSYGDKNSAITHDGIKVERTEYIFAEGYKSMVRCCPYELHFVYEDKSKKIGRWIYMCTCGSIAGIVSYKELVGILSPELGEHVLVCVAHTASRQNGSLVGYHADGSHE